ncbi:hypothetical protein BGX31_006811 [Mortierella sp. GBA43]|nr:hypothetical protein BGX31_006811 [Mortierella sp. GBA43]
MHGTQTFRLYGTTDVREIPFQFVGDQSVVLWKDIERVFPGARYIEHEGVPLRAVRIPHGKRALPHCIKRHPGAVLDVFLTPATAESDHSESSSSSQVGAPSSSECPQARSSTTSDASPSSQTSDVPMSPKLSSERALVLRQSTVSHITTEGNDTGEYIIVNQPQGQDPSPLAELNKKIYSILTTYEPYQESIPHLFIVIPQDISNWDITHSSTNKLRLYFLCECRDHIGVANSETPHHVHLANHKGYVVASPAEFLRQFGSYILTLHRMVKYRISMAGITVPELSVMINPNIFGQDIENLDEVAAAIGYGMDKISAYVEKSSSKSKVIDECEKTGGSQALYSTDLSRLTRFIKRRDVSKSLGSLYRAMTVDGHISWICKNHYHQYSSMSTQEIRSAVASVKGSINDNTGTVDVGLSSSVMADQFYSALGKSKIVYDLKIEFRWKITYRDLKKLHEAISKTRIGALRLRLPDHDHDSSSSFDILNYGRLYEPILEIMSQRSIRSVTLNSTPSDFFTRSNVFSRNDDISNLRYLEMDLTCLNQIAIGLKNLTSRAPSLICLTLSIGSSMLPAAYNAIMEYQTYPVIFKVQTMRISPPTDDVRKSNTDLRDLADLFRIHGSQIEALEIDPKWLDRELLQTFAEAIQGSSRLETLYLTSYEHLHGVEHVTSIVARSELRTLDISTTQNDGYSELPFSRRVCILESIRWSHIRELKVNYEDEKEYIWRALAKSIERTMPGQVKLEHLTIKGYDSEMDEEVEREFEEELGQKIFSPLKLKHLELRLPVTGKQVLLILKWIDVSRLEHFEVNTRDIDSFQVQAALDTLERASELRTLGLHHAHITPKQCEQMDAIGVTVVS